MIKVSNSLTRTPPRQSWGRGPSPLGVAANTGPSVDVSFTARAVQRRRVESLVLGALSSSPVHRALVLVLGTNIAVLLDCSSRLDSVAFLPYFLTSCYEHAMLFSLSCTLPHHAPLCAACAAAPRGGVPAPPPLLREWRVRRHRHCRRAAPRRGQAPLDLARVELCFRVVVRLG